MEPICYLKWPLKVTKVCNELIEAIINISTAHDIKMHHPSVQTFYGHVVVKAE